MCDITQYFVETELIAIELGQSQRVDDDMFKIPLLKHYDEISKINYRVRQLQKISRYYKLKHYATKHSIIHNLYNCMRLNHNASRIQKSLRCYYKSLIYVLRGPALHKRKICVNSTDCVSLEDIAMIPNHQFFSYTDIDSFIYGFNISSIYKLINTPNINNSNPYNRNVIPNQDICNLTRLLKISKMIGFPISYLEPNDEPPLSELKIIELRSLDVFQQINYLGNYTNPDWFNNLSRISLISFMHELNDMWVYRIQLTQTAKLQMCPPNGNPFHEISAYYYSTLELLPLKRAALKVMERLVLNAYSCDADKTLCAICILSALTLVSQEAALALPWLHDSVSISI
jgi:hypothetical protein